MFNRGNIHILWVNRISKDHMILKILKLVFQSAAFPTLKFLDLT